MNDPTKAKVNFPPTSSGLLGAHVLDGEGGGQNLDWEGIRKWDQSAGNLWIHLDRNSKTSQKWLRKESGLEPVTCDALLAEETRPRAQAMGNGLLVILRGVNLNEGEEPDDMISVRIWMDGDRIITLRAPKLLVISEVRADLSTGKGPKTSADTFVHILEKLTRRMSPVVANLDDLTDTAEEEMLENPGNSLRQSLTNIRRQAIALRRYIAPQREAIVHLRTVQLPWMNDTRKARIHECGDRSARFVEDLDSIRERCSIVHEELTARMSEQMNRTMYALSIVAGIFLPLGFVTGLLGINVGGMPGVDHPAAFGIVCIILGGLGAGAYFIFRRMRLF